MFKIISISCGWFDIDFNRQFILTDSDYLGCDAPALLLDALCSLMEHEEEEQWLCWQDEPGAYILKLERSHDQMTVKVYDTDADSFHLPFSGDGLASHATDCIYEFQDKISTAAEAIFTEFSLYENGNGREQYRRHWGDFPQKEYNRLNVLLGKRRREGTPPEGKLNGCQKSFFRHLANVQEHAVQSALAEYRDKDDWESALYDATYTSIVELMETIDGYSRFCNDKMDIVNQRTHTGMKENPFIELHDAVVDFIKDHK